MAWKRGEPNDVELRERIRKWLWHYRWKLETQRELAQALDYSETQISHVLRGIEDPGIDLFVRMHFRLGAKLEDMARGEPEDAANVPAPEEAVPRKKAVSK